MQWVSVLSLLSATSVILANDNDFNDAIQKYAEHCTEKYTSPGFMTIAYLVGNKNVYGRIDAFEVETFTAEQAEDVTAASRFLVQTACLCTEVKLNSYEFIVVPLMIDGIIGDALTVCVFHEVKDDQEVTEILSMPGIGFLRNWMTAQYYVHMIRTLNAPAADVTDCIGKDGHPVNNVIGQRTCYYVNLAKFEEGAAAIDVEQKEYFGPFLGSMIPNFMELMETTHRKDYLNFLTQFDFFKCSLLKNHTRIDSTVLETGCRFETFRDTDGAKTLKLVVVSCCCSGKDDLNCREVTSAVKEKKTLCIGGTDQNPTFFFANRCSHNVVREFKRIGAIDGSTPTFEHSKALRHESTTATFEKDATCESVQAVTCRSSFVHDTDQGCCNGPHFCNLHRFLNLAFKRCYWSFGEKQEIDGCMMIFYRAEDKWHTISSLWFEMEQSELIHLYSVAGNAPYEVSRALLVEKNVDSTCSEDTESYVRDYYVVSCYGKQNCDKRFTQEHFFEFLDEKMITEAMQKDSLPRCETGNVSFTKTDSVWTMPSVSPNTTRVIGVYCNVRLTVTDENTAIVTFEPVFPKPENCTRQVAKRDNSTYICCYPANSNASFIDEDCHYSTILEKAIPAEAEVTTPEATTESTDLILRQSVHEYADYCEQSNMDDFGVPSLQCQPGGIGCFHLLEMDEARDEVVASCVGHAEEKVAASKQFFDAFHEALLCHAEEMKNKCQYVILKSDAMPKLLCCCSVSVVRDNVAYCVEDTNTMFNEYKFELKTIDEYRDVKEDDEDDNDEDKDDNRDE